MPAFPAFCGHHVVPVTRSGLACHSSWAGWPPCSQPTHLCPCQPFPGSWISALMAHRVPSACHLRALPARLVSASVRSESFGMLQRGAGARPHPRAQPRLFIVLLPSPTPPPHWPAPSLGSLFLGQTGTCPLQGLPLSSRLSGSWHPWRGGCRRSGGVGVRVGFLLGRRGQNAPCLPPRVP